MRKIRTSEPAGQKWCPSPRPFVLLRPPLAHGNVTLDPMLAEERLHGVRPAEQHESNAPARFPKSPMSELVVAGQAVQREGARAWARRRGDFLESTRVIGDAAPFEPSLPFSIERKYCRESVPREVHVVLVPPQQTALEASVGADAAPSRAVIQQIAETDLHVLPRQRTQDAR